MCFAVVFCDEQPVAFFGVAGGVGVVGVVVCCLDL